MTTETKLLYCSDCGQEIEEIGDHVKHKLLVKYKYETIGQEVLAAAEKSHDNQGRKA